jgi:hypothetical protein
MKKLVFAVCFVLGGCAGQWNPETKVEEAVYQTASAVDIAQSLAISRNPDRLQEIGWPTASVIGSHPTAAATVAWGVGRGLAHAFVTDQLVGCGANDTVLRIWQGVSIGVEANTVLQNHSIGIGYTGSFK